MYNSVNFARLWPGWKFLSMHNFNVYTVGMNGCAYTKLLMILSCLTVSGHLYLSSCRSLLTS